MEQRLNIIRDAISQSPFKALPRLVAVSKFKSKEAILELYNLGVRCFGENRIDELVEKASFLPADIQWHFIGTIQSNKISALLGVPNLEIIETVDSMKHAEHISQLISRKYPGRVVKAFLQVNTSGEVTKHGFAPTEVHEAFTKIHESYKNIQITGLMTIGSAEESKVKDKENEDFKCLVRLKKSLDAQFNISLELSMGMSGDYEEAIRMGSTNIRIGSLLFGPRDK